MQPQTNPYYEQKTLFITGFAGCVDAETEYLTKTGWKRIADFEQGEEIAISKTRSKFPTLIHWEKPHSYIVNEKPSMAYKIFDYSNRSNLSMILTPEHNVIYHSAKGIKKSDTIKTLVNALDDITPSRGKRRTPTKIPTGF